MNTLFWTLFNTHFFIGLNHWVYTLEIELTQSGGTYMECIQ